MQGEKKRRDKVNCQHNTSWSFEEKAGVEGEEPAVFPLSLPPLNLPFPAVSGMQPPLLSVKQAF